MAIIFAVLSILLGIGLLYGSQLSFSPSMITICILFMWCVLDALYYAFSGKFCLIKADKQSTNMPIKYCISALCILFFVYEPLCTQGFFFHDDYLNFIGVNQNFYAFTISQGREATGILTDIMSEITVSNSYYLRFVSISGLGVFMLLLIQTIFKLTSSKKRAVIISLIITAIVPMVNVVAYGSMFCYSFAFVFSTIGIIHFNESLQNEEKHKKIFHMVLGMLSIIMANLIYQATAAIAFPVILLCWIMNDNSIKNKYYPIVSTVFFGLSTGVYYILIKIIAFAENISMMGRGGIISSIEQVIEKANFFMDVFEECIKQNVASFLGNGLFLSPWMHYTIDYKNQVIGMVTMSVSIFFLLLGFVQIWKKRRLLGVFQAAIFLPLSYYVFLILSENSYTSYYAGPLCISMLVIMYEGGVFAWNFLNLHKKLRYQYVGVVLLFLVVWNSNYYMREFWVGYNLYGYTYLKQAVSEYSGEERIHIYGSLYPGQADIYARSAAKMACKELGMITENITFTSSTNKDYIVTLTLEVYEDMMLQISEEEQMFLQDLYTVDGNFGICTLKSELLSPENREKLREIFRKTGIIPEQNENILIVDLQEITSVYFDR